MAEHKDRHKRMEQILLLALLGSLLLYIFYLIAAGNGIIWLKAILSILTILLTGLSLFFLHATGELLKRRSLWISVAAASILICTVFSLILNFPSPNPFP